MSECNGGVTVRLHGALRHAVGTRDVVLSDGVGTIGDALRLLAEQHGERAARMIFDRQGSVWRSLILLVNEEPASFGPETPVGSGDTISILLPLAGG
jgi:molybdopterin converting factor small subunit